MGDGEVKIERSFLMNEIPLQRVKLTDDFWRGYQTLIKETIIPYQYAVLNDSIDVEVEAEREDNQLPKGKSHALENFRIAAGLTTGEHFGWFFQDSDVYKWIEAAAYSLAKRRDEQLEALIDDIVYLIEKAQEEDGYLNTYFQLRFPDLKYRQLHFSHELYCAGHLIEAAIAYQQATGKNHLLSIALKFVNHIEAHFGYEEGKIQGADGHQEIELALGRLYEHTGEKCYLDLAAFFLDVRGKEPQFYSEAIKRNNQEKGIKDNPEVDLVYLQAYAQPKEQRTAEGHAVRMLYMAASMAKIANYQKDEELYEACLAIWEDVTQRKMYLTGGVGSTVHGEAFTGAYDLPNDTMYCETCASIALVYFAFEMYKIKPEVQYFEVIERALYNGILSGSSIDGTHFFYVNPLEVQRKSCQKNPGKGHVKTQRPDWLGCACCPPNFARFIGSMEKYIYTQTDEALWVNLLVGSTLALEKMQVSQRTNYPFENQVELTYQGRSLKLYIRIPHYLTNVQVAGIEDYKISEGYLTFEASEKTTVILTFEQPILSVVSNPKVTSNINQVSIQRGPFVYCVESIDNEEELQQYVITMSDIENGVVSTTADLIDTTLRVSIPAQKIVNQHAGMLYQYNQKYTFEKKALHFIPYHLWGNRGESEMRVWMNQKS